MNGHKITGAVSNDAIEVKSGNATITDTKGGGTVAGGSGSGTNGVVVDDGASVNIGGKVENEDADGNPWIVTPGGGTGSVTDYSIKITKQKIRKFDNL